MTDRSHPDDPIEDVSLGEVTDEVRDELARLFGAPVSAYEPGVEPEIEPTENLEDATGSESLGASPSWSDAASPTADATAARDVIPIGDPSFDTVAPLPIDPLVPVAAEGGVVQIVDDGTMPQVRDASDVSRVLIVDDDAPVGGSVDRDRKRRAGRGRRTAGRTVAGRTVAGRTVAGRGSLGRIKWLRLGAIATVAFIVVAAVLASPIFAIRTVVFDGAVYTADATIKEVRDLLDGSSVFTADVGLARERMLEDPWVAEVRITTDFPGRAVVEVAERVPVVWYAGDDQKARVVDQRGHVIAVLQGWPTKYLQVRGTGPSLEAGATADDAYRAAAQLVLALPEEIKNRAEALELSPGGELSMFLKGGTIVRFGPPVGLQDKLVAVVVLMRRQDPATLAVVDVSTGEPTVQTR